MEEMLTTSRSSMKFLEKVNLGTEVPARAHRTGAIRTQILSKAYSHHSQELHVRFCITITTSPDIMLIFYCMTAPHIQREKKDEKPLHPSWAAKKQLKEKQNPSIVAPQGTKIVF
jgi:hypothetical protein